LTDTVKRLGDGLAMKLPEGVRVSQVVSVQLCCETWIDALVADAAVTETVKLAGAGAPAPALKARTEALTASSVDVIPVTFRVTPAFCVTEPAVITIFPVHTVPAVMPAGLTETDSEVPLLAAVKVPDGATVSQSLAVQLCRETCAVALVFDGVVTVRVCDAGATAPATALKVNDEGVNSKPPEFAATIRVTLAVRVTEAVVMEMEPLQVVPAVMPAGLTEIVNTVPPVPALKAPVGDRVSQLLPVQFCWVAWAVALTLDAAVTVRVCAAGVAPPVKALNVKEEELRVSPPELVPPVTCRVML
jgi:hypothetical protein